MSRLIPVSWKILECIFLKAGFKFIKQRGSHRTYHKPGILRPIVIPTYKEISVSIIKNNIRTACMDMDTYFKYLEECK